MVESAQCTNVGTDKCPLNIDDRVDGLEGRVTDMDKDYHTFKVETAASQARTQALMEEMAKHEKERSESDAKEKKQMLDLICSGKKSDQKVIWRLIEAGVVILFILIGLKALVPGFLG